MAAKNTGKADSFNALAGSVLTRLKVVWYLSRFRTTLFHFRRPELFIIEFATDFPSREQDSREREPGFTLASPCSQVRRVSAEWPNP